MAPKNPRLPLKPTCGSMLSGPPVPGGPQVGPTGWYSLGQLIDAPAPFDLTRDPPGLVEPGDRIRFILDEVLE